MDVACLLGIILFQNTINQEMFMSDLFGQFASLLEMLNLIPPKQLPPVGEAAQYKNKP